MNLFLVGIIGALACMFVTTATVLIGIWLTSTDRQSNDRVDRALWFRAGYDWAYYTTYVFLAIMFLGIFV